MVATKKSTKLAEARIAAYIALPYFARQIMTLVPVFTESIERAAVDKHWRLYVNQAWADTIPKDELAAVVVHELFHLLQKYWLRVGNLIGDLPEDFRNCTDEQKVLLQVANIAGDCAINPVLRNAGLKLPQDCVWPHIYGLPELQTLEFYYHELLKLPSQKVQVARITFGGGSGSDGVRREWEAKDGGKGDSTDDDGSGNGDTDGGEKTPGGVAGHIQDRLIIQAAKDGSRAGKLGGDIEMMFHDLMHPVIPWQKELRARVSQTVNTVRGMGDFTYAKRNRRQMEGGVLLPGTVASVVRVTVVVDSSGSMGGDRKGSCLHEAMGELNGILKHMNGVAVRVLVYDDDVQSAQDVFDISQVDVSGCGGTDMSKAMQIAADEKPAPDLIIVLTDGYTPWPRERFKQKCIACITSEGNCSAPDWMRTIQINRRKGEAA